MSRAVRGLVRPASWATILGLVVFAGCDGNGAAGPDALTIEDLAGSWEGVQFTETSKANPSMAFDLIAAGGVFHIAVQPRGAFSGTVILPGTLLGDPKASTVTVPVAGVMRLLTGTTLRIDYIPQIPPLFTAMDPTFTLAGNELTIVDEHGHFDFDGDGVPEAAVFRGILVRK